MKLFDLGDRCAVLLPRNIINPYVTSTKCIIVNKLLDGKLVALVEEIWKVESFEWITIPDLLKNPVKHLAVALFPTSAFPMENSIINDMIAKSVRDFIRIAGQDA